MADPLALSGYRKVYVPTSKASVVSVYTAAEVDRLLLNYMPAYVAQEIEGIDVESYFVENVIIANTMVTNVLTAQKGYIADLTVDKLDTSDMVRRYLMTTDNPLRKAPVLYQRIFDEIHEKRVATYAGDNEGEDNAVQVEDYYGNPVYWLDSEHIGTGVTYDVTAYPCMRLVYDGADGLGVIKKVEYFVEESGTYVPATKHGLGNGVGNNGTMVERKHTTGYAMTYTATGAGDVAAYEEVILEIGDDGVRANSHGAISALRNVAICTNATEVSSALSNANAGDMLINTESFQSFSTSGTINRLGSHSVRFTGGSPSDINMPTSPILGDFFIFKNRGTAVATLKGTFDGTTDRTVTAGSSIKVQFNSTDWDVM